MKYVRLTMSPQKTSEVTENEYTDYKRWGLVLEEFDGAPKEAEASVSNDLGVKVPTKATTNTSKTKTAGS